MMQDSYYLGSGSHLRITYLQRRNPENRKNQRNQALGVVSRGSQGWRRAALVDHSPCSCVLSVGFVREGEVPDARDWQEPRSYDRAKPID
jgi:hypothetical protein